MFFPRSTNPRRDTRYAIALQVTFLLILPVAHPDWTKFEPLGDLPGGEFGSHAYAISGDGSTVVGVSTSERSGWNGESFRWTETDGMVGLGNFGPPHESEARGVSGDGAFVVGTGSKGGQGQAYRWSADEGLVGLGDLPGGEKFSAAAAISSDGSVVVGQSTSTRSDPYTEAVVWTTKNGMQPLVEKFTPFWPRGATSVSRDGSVVVGFALIGGVWKGFRWTAADGLVDLGEVEKYQGSGALDVSADGSTIVGTVSRKRGNSVYSIATRWTDRGLEELTNEIVYSQASAVSADGNVIVGWAYPKSKNTAYIWTADRGFRPLSDELFFEYGTQLDGYKLGWAYGVSDDGRTIAGWATPPDGGREAFRVHLGTFRLGDVNCDEAVDFDDIDAFVVALTGAEDYAAAYPDCRLSQADCNRDGAVDFNDIDPFVCCLIAGTCYDCR